VAARAVMWPRMAAAGAHRRHRARNQRRRRPSNAPCGEAAALGTGRHAATLGEREREREGKRREGKAGAHAAEATQERRRRVSGRNVGKGKRLPEGEAGAGVYICWDGFGREAAEADKINGERQGAQRSRF
jgi:hypothetical protein